MLEKSRIRQGLFTAILIPLASLGLHRSAQAHEFHQPRNQPPPAHEMPTRQLQYITHTPPSRWELQGVIAPRDLARLLLRRSLSGAARQQLQPIALGGAGDYTSEHFQSLNGPDLIKVEVADSGLKVLQAPARIVVMDGYGYILPLLARNHRNAARNHSLEEL